MTGWVLAPEALVGLGAVAALLAPALASPRTRVRLRRVIGWAALAVTLASLGLELWAGAQVGTLLAGGFVQDRFALFAKAGALLALAVAILAADWEEETLPGALPFAFLTALGVMAAASAAGVAQLWTGVALAAAAGGVALSRRVRGDVAAADELLLRTEAARGVITAGGLVLLAGLALAFLAALAGSSGLKEMAAALAAHRVTGAAAVPAAVALGALAALMLLAPFRLGGAGPAIGSPLGSGVAAAAGGAAGVALLRIGAALLPSASAWAPVLAWAAAAAVLLFGLSAAGSRARARGALGALAAAQLAWVVLGLAAHDREGLAASVLMLGAAMLGLAAAPVLLGGLADLVGLGQRVPGRAAGLALAVLSLAAVPPLGGFLGELLVALAAFRSGYGAAVGVALLGTLIGWGAAFRLVQSCYAAADVEEPRGARAAAARRPLGAAWTLASGGALVAGLVLLGYTVFANPISGLAFQSAEALLQR